MTRKQALLKALQATNDKEVIAKINEILEDMPFTSWNERTILDTIDQFIIDNGRVPTATDFKKKGLPPHTVIKLRFKMSLKEFLQAYYPASKLCGSKIYYNKTEEEWKSLFIDKYTNSKPQSAEEYNKLREEGTPSWQTIALMFGINKWSAWMEFCKLEKCPAGGYKPRGKVNLLVSSSIDLEWHLSDT